MASQTSHSVLLDNGRSVRSENFVVVCAVTVAPKMDTERKMKMWAGVTPVTMGTKASGIQIMVVNVTQITTFMFMTSKH